MQTCQDNKKIIELLLQKFINIKQQKQQNIYKSYFYAELKHLIFLL